jgi:hypothetical protein
MSVRTIPVGSKIHFVWVDGKTSSFVFRGTDSKGPIFENATGKRDIAAMDKPYLSMTVEPPRAS